jgi:polyisoprenoid-binding protein YceI
MTATGTTAPRRRRWLRWTLAGFAALLILLVGAVAAAIKLQPVPEPLTLPAAVAATADLVNGDYRPVDGSVAGFRVQQTVLGLTSDVVGRTTDLTGTATVAGSQITGARLRIGLLALTSGGGKPAPQFNISLDTQRYPAATVELTQPVAVDPASATGANTTATGTLTLHGITRTITVTMSVHPDGTGIDVAGALPVAFADYDLTKPRGYGSIGSLADHGTAEFLLLLRHN